MIATPEVLQEFNAFAHARIKSAPDQSMRDLFQAWLQQRECEEVVDDMQASDADIAAGRVTPAAEAIDEVRANLGIEK